MADSTTQHDKALTPARNSQSNRASLQYVKTESVVGSEENPRIHFPDVSMDQLAASVSEVGILVPLSVYFDKKRSKYVLIDGERRWKCAKNLGLTDVPAIILPPPNTKANLLTMFNIHMVREPWEDMPTAWALKKLIELTGNDDEEVLCEE